MKLTSRSPVRIQFLLHLSWETNFCKCRLLRNTTLWVQEYIFIDREAREIMYLVASVRPFVCLCALSCLNRLTYDLDIYGMTSWHPLTTFGQEYWQRGHVAGGRVNATTFSFSQYTYHSNGYHITSLFVICSRSSRSWRQTSVIM